MTEADLKFYKDCMIANELDETYLNEYVKQQTAIDEYLADCLQTTEKLLTEPSDE